MGSKLFSKLHKRYSDARTEMKTSYIIDEIFNLSEKNFRNNGKINFYMHELKSRGSDAIFEYYVKYVKRVQEEEVELEQINVYYALNGVLKLNEAEKIWNFVNLLQDLNNEHNFNLNYEKCSKAMAKTGNVTFNLYWAETYPEYNQANIEAILNSGNASAIVRMIELVDLTEEQINTATKIVKASENKQAKQDLKEVLKEKTL